MGIAPEVGLTRRGNVKDDDWRACQKFLSNPAATLERLHDFRDTINAGLVPAKNIKRVRKILRGIGHGLNPEQIRGKSVAAACLYKWLVSTLAYCEHASLIQEEPQASQPSPSVEAAAEACKHICKKDVVEIKSLLAPPQPVMIVCVCICILLGKDEGSGWAGAKATIADVTFLKRLLEHRKEDVTTEQVEKVRELLNKEGVDCDKLKSVSKAAYGLFQWVLAMIAE